MNTPSSEAQEFADFITNDPDLSEVTIEVAVVLDLLKSDRIPEASDRIEAWDGDFTDAAVLFLALAVLAHLPKAAA